MAVQITKTGELPQIMSDLPDRSGLRFVVYRESDNRTHTVGADVVGKEMDRNRRELKTVSTETYTVEPDDSYKVLLFTFDEGDVTITFSDSLGEINYGEFCFVCGDSTVAVFDGDGIGVRCPRGYLLRLPNLGVAYARLTSDDPGDVGGDFNSTGFYVHGSLSVDLETTEFSTSGTDVNETAGSSMRSSLLPYRASANTSAEFSVSGDYVDNRAISAAPQSRVAVADRVQLAPFVVGRSMSFSEIGVMIDVAVGGSTSKYGIYESDADGWPGGLLLQTATVSTASTGYAGIAITATLVKNRRYWLAVRFSDTPTYWVVNTLLGQFLGSGSSATSTDVYRSLLRSLSYATTLPDPWVFVTSDRSTAEAPIFRLLVS